jgi:CubicO group peptidase (beta-lactamase class C family)
MSTASVSDLHRSSPEQQGVNSSAIVQFVEELERQIQEIHSFMLLRHGSVIAEGWWKPYRPEYPHALFSVSKSFTSTAVGLAISEGYFSLDDPVLSFFPEEAPSEVSDYLRAMSVRHLLTMSTGHTFDTLASLVERPDGNWIKGFLGMPILYAPGTHFAYDTGATFMLSAIVQKTTGMKLVEYLRPRLFEPLGIENATWQESPQGIAVGGYGLSIKTEELARFGQLYLQRGRWEGRQLLPKTWVEASTSLQISNGNSAMQNDAVQGYGYQFWLSRHSTYRGSGVFGQYYIVMPEQDAVLAITGGIDIFDDQKVLDLVWGRILPAMCPEPLPEDAIAQDGLAKKLATLSLSPVQGQVLSPISLQVSGQTYAVDVNQLKIETITLNFNEMGCTVRFKTTIEEEIISCGYGAWQPGHTRLFNDARWFSNEPAPIVASGAWTAEDTFTTVVRLYETPFVYTLVYCFLSTEMMLEMRVNVSLDFSKPLLFTAHL